MRAVYRFTNERGAEPTADEIAAARDVVDSLIAAIGFANYAVRSSADRIEIDLPSSADAQDIQAALRPAGDFRFVPVPPERFIDTGDAVPPGLPALFGREGVASAAPGSDAQGRGAVDIVLTADASRRLDEWAANHFGDQLAIVAGGRVLAAPTINAQRFEGHLQIQTADPDQLLAVMRAPPLRGRLDEVAVDQLTTPAHCPTP